MQTPGLPTSAVRWNAADQVWETTLRGRAVLSQPQINKGTAFSVQEREQLGLIGLLPARILDIDEQAERAYRQYLQQPSDLAKNVFLTGLRDRDEVLFYRLIGDHLAEMLPIVYTPTVSEAIQRYSHEYRRPRGAYLSIDEAHSMQEALLSAVNSRDIDLIIATDAEGILGIGDWGVGGIEIAVGKLNVYTAAAGIDPARTLAVMLDVGTSRQELLEDPLYLGIQRPRVGREEYDAFIERYVTTACRLFPHALLHWEDFGTSNARRILDRYRPRTLTFNDDMQGTGAVSLAAVLSASARADSTALPEHRVVVHGSGTAGIGIADQIRDAMVAAGLSHEEATRRFWCIGRHGLLADDRQDLRDFQRPYARPSRDVADWEHDTTLGGISLDEVVRRVHPTILIGTSAQPGAFTESVVREMASHVEHPIVMPMSNPTRLAEAEPADLLMWTNGKALVATGSPFADVHIGGVTYRIAQVNNALVFPGLGLGVIVSRAVRITDGMLMAAARAVAELAATSRRGAPLLPSVSDLRTTSVTVAAAVAWQAHVEGVASAPVGCDLEQRIQDAIWSCSYHPVRAV